MMKGRKALADRLKHLSSPAAIAKIGVALFNGGELLATEIRKQFARAVQAITKGQ